MKCKSQILTYLTVSRTGCYCQTFKFQLYEDDRPLGRYGRMALAYLRDNPLGSLYGAKNGWITHGNDASVQRGGLRTDRAFDPTNADGRSMPATDDILERTRHLNDLKSLAEETILQAFAERERNP